MLQFPLSANDGEREECISMKTKTYWIGCSPGGIKHSVHASSVLVEILHTNIVIQGMTCIFFKALIWIFLSVCFCPSSFVFILSVKYHSGEDLNLFLYLENWPNNSATFYSSDSAKCGIHRKSGSTFNSLPCLQSYYVKGRATLSEHLVKWSGSEIYRKCDITHTQHNITVTTGVLLFTYL